jgi:hypothetical protein
MDNRDNNPWANNSPHNLAARQIRSRLATWRVICSALLCLLNTTLALSLFFFVTLALREALNPNPAAAAMAVRDIVLCCATAVATILQFAGTLLATARLYLSSHRLIPGACGSAAAGLLLQIAVCLTLFWNPTRSQGCFSGLAAFGEAVVGCALVLTGALMGAVIMSILWLTTARHSTKRKKSGPS